MAKIDANCRVVCEAAEFVAIVTAGNEGLHLVGNWGEYLRALGIREDILVLPAGRYHRTEQNLRRNHTSSCCSPRRRCRGRAPWAKGT